MTLRDMMIEAAGSGIDRYYEETAPDFADDRIKYGYIADAALTALNWRSEMGLV